jgi:signal transduction histidine kinase
MTGIDIAGNGKDRRVSGARWARRLHVGPTADGAALLAGGGGAVAQAQHGGTARTLREDWVAIRARLAWLEVLVVASAFILALEFIRPIAYHAPALRATAETVIALFGLTGAWLLWAQFAHTRRLRDLLLLGAVLMLSLAELSSSALPAALEVRSGSQFAAALLCGRLFAAATLAAAAFTPSDRLIVARRPVAIAVVLSVAACVVAQLISLLLRGALVAVETHPVRGIDRALQHPLGFVIVTAVAGLFAYAANAFARRGRVERSGESSLLAGAAILLAAAQLYYLALPWLSLDWVTPREGLRLLAFALILAAVAREQLRVHAGTARAAATAERRRLARDLHDGLAQDLAFIAAHSARMAHESGEHPVAVAARRALAMSRGAITELSDWSSVPTHEALAAIAYELSDRFAIVISVEADLDAELMPDVREHIARITGEAIANAARHGNAENVIVSLKRTATGVTLRVRDDGCGMEVPGARPEGFGLRSMRERAVGLGGQLTVRPRATGGTELEVVLP